MALIYVFCCLRCVQDYENLLCFHVNIYGRSKRWHYSWVLFTSHWSQSRHRSSSPFARATFRDRRSAAPRCDCWQGDGYHKTTHFWCNASARQFIVPVSSICWIVFNMELYLIKDWIFTDGSKIWEVVGAAAIVASWVHNKCLPNNASIFSTEAPGILLALDMVRRPQGGKLLFLSDSLSCLQSLQKRVLSHPLIAEVLCRFHGFLITWNWSYVHVGA